MSTWCKFWLQISEMDPAPVPYYYYIQSLNLLRWMKVHEELLRGQAEGWQLMFAFADSMALSINRNFIYKRVNFNLPST